ncbi:TIGR02647 family protein [Pontibacterium sp.]|uniref:TIGR02647 family protein n=1 Tax=Pontibacterium sp. TaxID=2036026 RepID=UPI0035162965
MPYNQSLLDELNLLSQFSLESTQSGIKVHHTAAQEMIDAAKRLHDKGLITQDDGGYLTPLGRDALEHSEALIMILTTENRQPI